MSDWETRDSAPSENKFSGNGICKEEGDSFWKQKIGGGAILMWLVISVVTKVPGRANV